jgi:hypothetical protein
MKSDDQPMCLFFGLSMFQQIGQDHHKANIAQLGHHTIAGAVASFTEIPEVTLATSTPQSQQGCKLICSKSRV